MTYLHCSFLAAAMSLLTPAALAIEWEVRDVDHPALGAIKVAVPRAGVSTAVREQRIVSAAFVSCEKGAGTIAIELANSLESDAKGGLKPAEPPHLVCSTPVEGRNALASTEIAAKWQTSELGDTMARGLSASALRQCLSIDVLQAVAVPQAGAKGQRVTMEITPYSKGLVDVLAACGAKDGWRAARSAAGGGKTNVRDAPRINGAVVTQLEPNARILVEPASGPWWRARPRSGAGFSGYIREDRLAFE